MRARREIGVHRFVGIAVGVVPGKPATHSASNKAVRQVCQLVTTVNTLALEVRYAMSLGSAASYALENPDRLPDARGDNDCPSCGRTYHQTHDECPACGCAKMTRLLV